MRRKTKKTRLSHSYEAYIDFYGVGASVFGCKLKAKNALEAKQKAVKILNSKHPNDPPVKESMIDIYLIDW